MIKCSKLSIIAIVAVLLMAFSFVPPTNEIKEVGIPKVTFTSTGLTTIISDQIASIKRMKPGHKVTFFNKQNEVVKVLIVTEKWKKEALAQLTGRLMEASISSTSSNNMYMPPCGGAGCFLWPDAYPPLCCCYYEDCDGGSCQTWSYCYPT